MSIELQKIIAIIEFIGSNMTEEQAVELIDMARSNLSRHEIAHLMDCINVPPALYTELSMYNGEMGGMR